MKTIKALFLILLLCFSAACEPKLNENIVSLVNGKNLWLESVPQQNYSYTMVRMCKKGCSYSWVPIRVHVAYNEVIRVTNLEYKTESKITEDLPTVISIFNMILAAIKERQLQPDNLFEVKYNST